MSFIIVFLNENSLHQTHVNVYGLRSITADIKLLSLGIHTTRFEILNLFVGKQINACLVVFITMHIDIATCALLIIKLDISEWKYITEKKKKSVFLFVRLTLLN